MAEVSTFEQFVNERFGGVLSTGAHDMDGLACVLEALNACHERKWTDDPLVARTFDLRPLNDARWSDNNKRTYWMVRLGSALDGSLDWPVERQQRFTEQVVRETVRQIIAELPSLPDEIRNQCRLATSMQQCAAAAAYAAARAAYAAARAAARAAYAAARAAVYAAAYAAAYVAAYAAAYVAADAAAAAGILETACRIWLEAAEASA